MKTWRDWVLAAFAIPLALVVVVWICLGILGECLLHVLEGRER